MTAETEVVAIVAGRRPNIAGLGLENTQIVSDKGGVIVDDTLQTGEPGIYATGDLLGNPMFAHWATAQALAVARHLLGAPVEFPRTEHNSAVIFSYPEIGMVGLTEEAARAEGLDVGVAEYDYKVDARAQISGDADGLVRIVYVQESHRIVGVHVLVEGAADIMGEAALAVRPARRSRTGKRHPPAPDPHRGLRARRTHGHGERALHRFLDPDPDQPPVHRVGGGEPGEHGERHHPPELRREHGRPAAGQTRHTTSWASAISPYIPTCHDVIDSVSALTACHRLRPADWSASARSRRTGRRSRSGRRPRSRPPTGRTSRRRTPCPARRAWRARGLPPSPARRRGRRGCSLRRSGWPPSRPNPHRHLRPVPVETARAPPGPSAGTATTTALRRRASPPARRRPSPACAGGGAPRQQWSSRQGDGHHERRDAHRGQPDREVGRVQDHGMRHGSPRSLPRTVEVSRSRACTNACGRLPRSWRCRRRTPRRAGPGARRRSVALEHADRAAASPCCRPPAPGRTRTAGTRPRPCRAGRRRRRSGRRSRRRGALADRGGWRAMRGSSPGARRGPLGAAARHRRRLVSGCAASSPAGARTGASSRAGSRRRARAMRSGSPTARAVAARRSPATHASREWLHQSSSSSQIPASGSCQRASITSTASRAAAMTSASATSCRAAAAKSCRASPKASSWNWPLTQLPRDVGAAGVAGQLEPGLVRDRPTVDRVGGLEVGAVREQGAGHESRRGLAAAGAARRRPRRCPRSTGPGSRRSGSRSCVPAARAPAGTSSRPRPSTAGGRQAAQHRVRLPGVRRCRTDARTTGPRRPTRARCAPRRPRGRPGRAAERPRPRGRGPRLVRRELEVESELAGPPCGAASALLTTAWSGHRCVAVHRPSAPRCRSVMLAAPNPARTSSRTRTRAGPSCASIRRRITARGRRPASRGRRGTRSRCSWSPTCCARSRTRARSTRPTRTSRAG